MAYNGTKWWKVGQSGGTKKAYYMAENRSLFELASEMNRTLVKAGRPNWRREFNARLWSCSRDRALDLMAEYRQRVLAIIGPHNWDEVSRRLLVLPRR
jgi:hypothetical protein